MERSKKLALAFIMIIAILSSYIVPSAMNKGHYINGVLLVNKKYGLPKDYNPGESKAARSEFERMKKNASKSNIYLNAFSTFRTYSYQYNLYWNYVKKDGQEKADTYSARPGYSEHQTGLAFDIGGKNSKLWANDGFHNTTEAKWLANNAHNYGFILRYPKGKEHITGYKYESWHYRYVGVELAKKIYNSGLCLEEYLGEYKNGWHKQDNKWYYYQDNNKVYGWKKISGSWYYLDENGQMATGWKKISGVWYYLNEDGRMATGWKKVSGTWYYLNEDGRMATGWKQLNGSWYYLKSSGAMATGWEKVDGSWYYLESSGAMKTGWLKDNNKWYYLQADGAMATGWKKISRTWSYTNSHGITVTETEYTWYYFYDSGVMAINTTIDGWIIDGNGVATAASSNDNNNNWEDDSDEQQGTVYITPNGKSYHNSRSCTALKRSSTVLAVSYSEAVNRGKSDPCNLCVR